jgi:hypothetical protein
VKERIIVTGPGRSGTTFLMNLLRELGNHVGDMEKGGYNFTSHAGYELPIDHSSDPYIVKSPEYSFEIEKLSKEYKINLVLCPIRNLEDTVKSRFRIGSGNGAC